MTDIDLDHLRAKAETMIARAPQISYWEPEDHTTTNEWSKSVMAYADDRSGYMVGEVDDFVHAEFIASLNPRTVLALIDRLEGTNG